MRANLITEQKAEHNSIKRFRISRRNTTDEQYSLWQTAGKVRGRLILKYTNTNTNTQTLTLADGRKSQRSTPIANKFFPVRILHHGPITNFEEKKMKHLTINRKNMKKRRNALTINRPHGELVTVACDRRGYVFTIWAPILRFLDFSQVQRLGQQRAGNLKKTERCLRLLQGN